MPGASPLASDLDRVRRLEDAGAAAIVLESLFEEQITLDRAAAQAHLGAHEESSPEARSYAPDPPDFFLGPEKYLEHLRKVKAAVGIPVIASLNGSTSGGWLEYARHLEQAGADGLELNVYAPATDPGRTGAAVERSVLECVRSVRGSVRIPLAVKLSPFYSSMANLARELDTAGAGGLVLFNRFYQSDLDIEALSVERTLRLSDSTELPLRLRWLAILSGRVRASLAVTGGVHTVHDAVKAIMAGAHAVQVVSALLKEGPGRLRTLREELARWLEAHEYQSLEQMQGSMGLARCPDPARYERENYLHVLQAWHGGGYRESQTLR